MKKILIVEDTKNIKIMIEKFLINKGFQVECAMDGVEALVKVFDLMPDIVLLDLVLPKLSGILVCEAIRSNEKFLKLPVIMMSSMTNDENIKAILEAGASDYITKPFTLSELLYKMKKYEDQRGEHYER